MYPSFLYDSMFGFLSGVAGLIRSLFGVAGVVLYVLRSVSLYRMARNTGMTHEWFAWIPFLHEYQCAKMADRTRAAQNRPPFLEKVIVAGAAAYVLLSVFRPILGGIFLIGALYRLIIVLTGVALYAVAVISDYWLFADFEPNLCALFTVLSVFRLDGVAKFLVRDNIPAGVAGVCSPRQPKYNAGPAV